MEVTAMPDPATLPRLTHAPLGIPLFTPELLVGPRPVPIPPGRPFRFALARRTECEQPRLAHACFERLGLRYDIEDIPGVPFNVDLSFNMLSGIKMASGRVHGSRNRRTRAQVEDGTDDIHLIVNRGGPYLIEQRDRELVLDDGEAVLVSMSDPSCFTHQPPGDLLAMRFPKRALAPLLRRGSDACMRRIARHDPALGLLRCYVSHARDHGIAADLQHLMATHIYDLIAVMAGATRDAEAAAQDGGGLHAARLHAIKQDIAHRLDQPDLSVAALAQRHGCTPRLVQRLFEQEGSTFTEYVLSERLARAYRVLADPRRRVEKISTVALDCGFGDVSYFNRAFRRRYGAAPSDVRAQARGDVSPSSRRDH
jgi:AraC-like DNA-binding protein